MAAEVSRGIALRALVYSRAAMRAIRLPTATTSARILAMLRIALILGATALAAYWGSQIVSGVPDAYRGEHRGGFFLALSMLFGNLNQPTGSPWVQFPLLFASLASLALAVSSFF